MYNNRLNLKNKNKGVSMITLVITIIVIVILAGIVFSSSTKTISTSGKSTFVQELHDVEMQVAQNRMSQQMYGTTEEIINQEFYKSYVKNPPANFESFDKNSIYGYVVDMEKITYLDAKFGHDYINYKGNPEDNIVVFGEDDVYIYDKGGNVYYAKGFDDGTNTYHSLEDIEDKGPIIKTIEKIVSEDNKTVTIKIGVEKIGEGSLSVKVEDVETTSTGIVDNIEYFEIDVYENKTYKIVASETGVGTSIDSVIVSEIEATTYQIRYDANGGENPPDSQIKTENVILRLTIERPTRDNYDFLGWSSSSTAEFATYKPGAEFILNEDTTLYAVWRLKSARTYTLIYNANNGEGAPEKVTDIESSVLISSKTPTREGYTFEGWSKKLNTIEAEYQPAQEITLTENLTLYAVWKKLPNTLTVTLKVEPSDPTTGEPLGGTVTGAGVRSEGTNVSITAEPKLGYRFKKWTINEGRITLADGFSEITNFTMPDQDVELTANFELIDDILIKYDANKGRLPRNIDEKVYYASTVNITDVEPTRDGYDFLGWALTRTAENPTHSFGDTYSAFENVIFYAVWSPTIEVYRIEYDLNKGESDDFEFVTQTKTEGEDIKIYTEKPRKLGFNFYGWNYDENSNDVVYNPGDTYERDSDALLYAVYIDELAPYVFIDALQEGDSISIVGNGHDEGLIVNYAWTRTDETPTTWIPYTSNKDISIKKLISEGGTYYFWLKDLAGNESCTSINIYEIKYNNNGGSGGPATQYKAESVPLKLSELKPTKLDHVFLGWSTNNLPGNEEESVSYIAGGEFSNDVNQTLTAVWGETFFELDPASGTTEIDGVNVSILVNKSKYTGEITVTSEDEDIATVSIAGNKITVKPGIKIGTVTITAVESTTNSFKTAEITVNKGTRKLTINEATKSFVYGDDVGTVGFSYNGKIVNETRAESSDEGVAKASVKSGKINIDPQNVGEAIITLIVPEDDQYREIRGTVKVSVTRKTVIVIPDSGQFKEYADPEKPDQELTYTYTGTVNSEEAGFTGALTREKGSVVGKYEISRGTLELADKGTFDSDNYELKLSTQKVYFSIVCQKIAKPTAIKGQMYDGTTKYGVEDSPLYKRSGAYAKIPAGTYTAIIEIEDKLNYIWEDNTNTALYISWTLAKKTITDSNVTVSDIADVGYVGSEMKPVPTVRDNERNVIMQKDIDYTLEYSDNINVGQATITIKGKGNYDGQISKNFKIKNADMTINASGYNGVYDNKLHSITINPIWPTNPSIYYSTTPLTSTNYNSIGSTDNPTYKNITSGTTIYYYIKNTNFNDYAGSCVITINPKSISNNIEIRNVVDEVYKGSAVTQTPALYDKDLERTLIKDSDYSLSYSNNLYPGTATMVATGINNYTGTTSKTFTINGDAISISKSSDSLESLITVSISNSLEMTTLQYKIDESNWMDYSSEISITSDCTIYARTKHNNEVIGTAQMKIDNICEHSYTTATCTEASVCRYCDKENTPKKGHDFSKEEKTSTYLKVNATCTTPAEYWYKCTRCEAMSSIESYTDGEPMGHNWVSVAKDEYLVSEATCTSVATYHKSCSRCYEEGTETFTSGSSLEHDYSASSSSVRTTATCTEAGTNYYKCSRCTSISNTEYYVVTLALEHDYSEASTEVAKPATCLNAGTNYYKCSRCGLVSSVDTYIAINALGHDFTSQTTTSTYLVSMATCTNPAVYKYKCSRCTEAGSDTYVFGSETGHDYDATLKSAATCIESDIYEYVCKNCNDSYTEGIGTPLYHTYGSWYDAGDTHHAKKCQRCSYTPTELHSYGSWVNASSSQHKKTCSVCSSVVYESHGFRNNGGSRICDKCGATET